MPLKCGLRFVEEGRPPSELVIELPDEDVELLRDFQREARKVLETRFCMEGANVNLHMNWEEGKGLRAKVDLPPWDDVVIALHKLRPLILQDEPANFLKAKGVVSRHFKDAPVRPLLKLLGDQFSGQQMRNVIVFSSNDEVMNSEKMLFTWLNAYEYHRDPEKKVFLDTLHKILPLEWSQGIFVFLIVEKAKAIGNLFQVCDFLLGGRESLSVKI